MLENCGENESIHEISKHGQWEVRVETEDYDATKESKEASQANPLDDLLAWLDG